MTAKNEPIDESKSGFSPPEESLLDYDAFLKLSKLKKWTPEDPIEKLSLALDRYSHVRCRIVFVFTDLTYFQ